VSAQPAVAPVQASSQVGLSAHAQALWRRSLRFRRMADALASDDSRPPS
jgi:hypothetical protein